MSINLESTQSATWAEAVAELGLDHPAVMRLPAARGLMEEAHRVHEQRRALGGKVREVRKLLRDLMTQEEQATATGLELLGKIRAEIASHTADLADLNSRLTSSLAGPSSAEVTTGDVDVDSFVARYGLRDQYETLLDMFSAFGAFDLRARSIRFHGTSGRLHQLPTFDSIVGRILTDEIRTYLAEADRVRLLVTPAADQRVFHGVGKTVAFNNYAVAGVAAEGPEACVDFVQNVNHSPSGRAVADDLLNGTSFDGVRVALYAESDHQDGPFDLRGRGMGLDAICEDIEFNAAEASEGGVEVRPLSPPEYLMLQAMRRRFGLDLLDSKDRQKGGSETWFPGHQIKGAAGTLVARSVGAGLRFRADETGRGSESRGYRVALAPVAA